MHKSLLLVVFGCAAPLAPAQVYEPITTALLDTWLSPYAPTIATGPERSESALAWWSGSIQAAGRLDRVGLPLLAPYPLAELLIVPAAGDDNWVCGLAAAAGPSQDLTCQRVTREFAPVTSPVTITSYDPGSVAVEPQAASDRAGNLVVAWRERPAFATDPALLKFRLVSAAGDLASPVVGAFSSFATVPAFGVARLPGGDFVLVAQNPLPTAWQVWAQPYDGSGAQTGSAFQVAVPPASTQDIFSQVRAAGDGFAVLWSRQTIPLGDVSTYLRRYDAGGLPIAPPAPYFAEPGIGTSGRMSLGCDGWGRCVAFSWFGARAFDKLGEPVTPLLLGYGISGTISVSSGGLLTLVRIDGTDALASRLPQPVQWSVSATRYLPGVKGDLDADHATDLVLQHTPSGSIALWAMNGTVRNGSPRHLASLPGPGWQVVGSDDFDGDWRQDLVLWNANSGAVEFWYMGGDDGTARLGIAALTGVPPFDPSQGWRVAATGDFSADGKPDLLWRNDVTGALRVWRMDGNAYVETLVPNPDHAADANWRVVAALDFDNDGRRDLLWYNRNSGRAVFWYLDSQLNRLSARFVNPPSAGDNNWSIVAAGDWGSGSTLLPRADDLLWRNQDSGRLVVWHMDPAGNRVSGVFATPAAPKDPLDWVVAAPR